MIPLLQAIAERHAVRSYTDAPLDPAAVAELQELIGALNEESSLSMQLILDEPKAFSGLMAKAVGFSNARNYLALVGPECRELDEVVGYYGEQVVLAAQQLGINSCWVGKTYRFVAHTASVDLGQKLDLVVALGYGTDQGKPHKSKTLEEVCPAYREAPEWFRRGVDAALLAPTALNQQKFSLALGPCADDGTPMVIAKAKRGPFTMVDLGIVKYHFEVGTGNTAFQWAD